MNLCGNFARKVQRALDVIEPMNAGERDFALQCLKQACHLVDGMIQGHTTQVDLLGKLGNVYDKEDTEDDTNEEELSPPSPLGDDTYQSQYLTSLQEKQDVNRVKREHNEPKVVPQSSEGQVLTDARPMVKESDTKQTPRKQNTKDVSGEKQLLQSSHKKRGTYESEENESADEREKKTPAKVGRPAKRGLSDEKDKEDEPKKKSHKGRKTLGDPDEEVSSPVVCGDMSAVRKSSRARKMTRIMQESISDGMLVPKKEAGISTFSPLSKEDDQPKEGTSLTSSLAKKEDKKPKKGTISTTSSEKKEDKPTKRTVSNSSEKKEDKPKKGTISTSSEKKEDNPKRGTISTSSEKKEDKSKKKTISTSSEKKEDKPKQGTISIYLSEKRGDKKPKNAATLSSPPEKKDPKKTRNTAKSPAVAKKFSLKVKVTPKPPNKKVVDDTLEIVSESTPARRKRGRPRKDAVVVKQEKHSDDEVDSAATTELTPTVAAEATDAVVGDVDTTPANLDATAQPESSQGDEENVVEGPAAEETAPQTEAQSESPQKKQIKAEKSVKKREPKSRQTYPCDICGKMLSNKPNLKVHMKSHAGAREYRCETCGKCSTTRANLNRHMRKHTGEKPYMCAICGKCFSEKKTLTVHQRKHTGERPFTCDLCDKTFAQMSSLRCHQLTHSNLKPHLCGRCGQSFRQKSQLRTHEHRHTVNKILTCKICAKEFDGKGDLYKHMVSHADVDKLHSCQLCPSTFFTYREMRNHLVTHSGKGYRCDICEVAFPTRSDMLLHMRNVHDDDSAVKRIVLNPATGDVGQSPGFRYAAPQLLSTPKASHEVRVVKLGDEASSGGDTPSWGASVRVVKLGDQDIVAEETPTRRAGGVRMVNLGWGGTPRAGQSAHAVSFTAGQGSAGPWGEDGAAGDPGVGIVKRELKQEFPATPGTGVGTSGGGGGGVVKLQEMDYYEVDSESEEDEDEDEEEDEEEVEEGEDAFEQWCQEGDDEVDESAREDMIRRLKAEEVDNNDKSGGGSLLQLGTPADPALEVGQMVLNPDHQFPQELESVSVSGLGDVGEHGSHMVVCQDEHGVNQQLSAGQLEALANLDLAGLTGDNQEQVIVMYVDPTTNNQVIEIQPANPDNVAYDNTQMQVVTS